MIKRRQQKVYRDKRHFISSWLTASPTELRTTETDMEKRLETLLEALHREYNILKFKPRG